ncbi:MAG: hypothetical protein M1823_000064 [Watsoniomyces obsoletus]|nr:MAG: hypothetical protein M1823_000064 [Watsoniomyces obsoletus]
MRLPLSLWSLLTMIFFMIRITLSHLVDRAETIGPKVPPEEMLAEFDDPNIRKRLTNTWIQQRKALMISLKGQIATNPEWDYALNDASKTLYARFEIHLANQRELLARQRDIQDKADARAAARAARIEAERQRRASRPPKHVAVNVKKPDEVRKKIQKAVRPGGWNEDLAKVLARQRANAGRSKKTPVSEKQPNEQGGQQQQPGDNRNGEVVEGDNISGENIEPQQATSNPESGPGDAAKKFMSEAITAGAENVEVQF